MSSKLDNEEYMDKLTRIHLMYYYVLVVYTYYSNIVSMKEKD